MSKLSREERVKTAIEDRYYPDEVNRIMRMYKLGMINFFDRDGKTREVPLLRFWHPLGFLLLLAAIIACIPFDMKHISLLFKYTTFKW